MSPCTGVLQPILPKKNQQVFMHSDHSLVTMDSILHRLKGSELHESHLIYHGSPCIFLKTEEWGRVATLDELLTPDIVNTENPIF